MTSLGHDIDTPEDLDALAEWLREADPRPRAPHPGHGGPLLPPEPDGRGDHPRLAGRLPEIEAGDDLGAAIAAAAPPDLAGDDVLVVAHKAISKAEGRRCG